MPPKALDKQGIAYQKVDISLDSGMGLRDGAATLQAPVVVAGNGTLVGLPPPPHQGARRGSADRLARQT